MARTKRSNGATAPEAVRAILADALPDACRLLIRIADDDEVSMNLRLKALEMLLELGLGKPRQAVTSEDIPAAPQVIFMGGDRVGD